MRSAPCAFLACGVALAMLLSGVAILPPEGPSPAVLKNAPALVASSKFVAIGLAIPIILAVLGIMLLTARLFGVIRSTSKIFAALFPMIVCAIPMGAGLSMTPIVLCLTVMLSMMIMYTVYMRPNSTRRIFLVFTLLSAGSCISYGFAFFIPVMLFVAAQMRCLTIRSLIASLIGIITPFWILLGFGIISPHDFAAPDILWISPGSLHFISPAQMAAIGVLVVVTLLAVIFNLIKVYRFNARSRAFNGVVAALTLWTILWSLLDFGNAIDYMPLLAALGSLQIALWFELDRSRRLYISILILFAAIIALYIWNLLSSIS